MSNIPNETKDSQAPVKEFFDNYFKRLVILNSENSFLFLICY